MASLRFPCLLLCVVATTLLAKTSFALHHELTLTNNVGSTFTYNTSQPSLTPSEGVCPIVDFCTIGVWILYDDINYDGSEIINIRPYLEKTCNSFLLNKCQLSARTVGVEADTIVPSVTFFRDINFEGEATLFTADIPNFDIPFESLVTVNTTVEFFMQTDYQGDSFCLDVRPFYCLDNVCWLWHQGVVFLPFHLSLANSVKFGCVLPELEQSASEIQQKRTLVSTTFSKQ